MKDEQKQRMIKKFADAGERAISRISDYICIGDKVKHKTYGTGDVFEVSHKLGYADVNLDKEYIDKSGRIRNSAVLPISELIIVG